MRQLILRFLGVDERATRATRTFKDRVPDAELLEVSRWATRGGKIWGRERKRVTINVMVRPKNE